MYMQKNEKILIFATLLHDIGKLNYSQNNPHEKSGLEFIDRCNFLSNNEKNEIKNLIINHHVCRDGTKLDELEDMLLKILIKSDYLSAGMERIEDKTEEMKSRYYQPLISPLSEIILSREIDRETLRYPILLMNKNFFDGTIEDFFPQDEKNAIWKSRKIVKKDYPGKNLKIVYEETAKKLKEELNKTNLDVNSLLSILKIYLQFIPSATYREIPDIPLFDHLKTTAAIALSLYRANNKRKPFLLVGGDISGIQHFIFSHFKTIESDKKSAKRLRGRSFYINLLIDAIIYCIQKELKLYDFSILWASGGNFVMLVPNSEENKNKLNQIKKYANRELYEKYGNIYLSFSWEEGNEDDIKNFSKFLDRLNYNIEIDKIRKFFDSQEILKNSIELFSGEKICAICGRNTGTEKEERYICEYCERLEEIGSKLIKAKYIIRNPDLEEDIKFDFGSSYRLSEKLEKGEYIFGINRFSSDLKGFKLLGIYTPKISFDQVVSNKDHIELRKSPENYGIPTKMALLKADVDNLGLIFSLGLERSYSDETKGKEYKSISRITFLSFLFDYFFNIKLNRLAKKYNIYILFSGGDDIIAAGRFDEIIKFAEEINENFKNFVKNEEITLSCGIEISDYKFPIKRFVEYADEKLKESKNKGKNKITLFDCTVNWSQFKEEINLSKKLHKLISNNKIGTGFIFNLLKLSGKSFAEKVLENEQIILNPEPYLRYLVSRNFNTTEKEKEEIINLILKKDENINNFKYINICVSLISLLNRYELCI